MREITRTGDAIVVVVGMTVVFAAWPGWTTALVAGSAALGLALFSLFKRVANRPRPDGVNAVLAAPDRFSMPSGHATCAFAIAVAAMVLVPAVGAPLLLWASLVSSSRVVLGVHYPFDVLAGVTLGAASAAFVTGLA
jgi:undecaprenyl-diphosphatase